MEEETLTGKMLWLYFYVTVKLHILELTAPNRLFCGAILGGGGFPYTFSLCR